MTRPPPAPSARPTGPPAEVTRVKLRGYLLALLFATPGLTLLLLHLIRSGATALAVTHGAVMLSGAVLTALVWQDARRLPHAERIFAGLLLLSGVNFLSGYALNPGAPLDAELLGSVLLFIVTGLLLVLPPAWSLGLAVLLLGAYRLEVNLLSGEAPGTRQLTQWVNLGMFALLAVGVVMRQTLGQVVERAHLLAYLATHDPLTGLLNRRGFEDQAHAGQNLLVLDADDFKLVNDTHGHVVGDDVLRQLARTVQEHLPPGSLLARWGGEEFVLVSPGDLRGAAALGETLRATVATTPLAGQQVTLSLGGTHWAAGEPFRDAFARADRALYRAKRSGKNRVHLHAAEDSTPVPAGH
ncbi:GGDEF domain-containing protein [Deinococcus xianganensis]|uniref:Diguanylate cyclase n=1 Tax=Deinococcus xianganensis TaxID=1507289 RepID=A0A6I4YCC5_9DEIO|nr:GGDEF domain-containing protein [Deinococcus xianganensis]MXV18688.1 diguanylate cyclase [Deinococcus xianganensis]